MTGFMAVMILLAGGRCAMASSADTPFVHAVSAPEIAGVPASTRNASLAAAKLVGVEASVAQGFEDIAIIDASVLETPLDATEQAAARDTIAIMGGVGQGALAESMNMAQDRFEGKFDATPHH
jgi:hypothetical protein